MSAAQAKRAQLAMQAAMGSSAELLEFLREFNLAATSEQRRVAAGESVPRRVALGAGAPARAPWAPPAASERFTAVPFKPLAIVPLPGARRTQDEDTASVDEKAALTAGAVPRPGSQELLPTSRRPGRRSRTKASLVVGLLIGSGAVALGVLVMVAPGPGRAAHHGTEAPYDVVATPHGAGAGSVKP